MPVWERTAHPLGQIQSLSQGEHLPDGTLQALHLSDRNALWVATNSGVARVAWPDPVAVVREPPALQTIIEAITRHEGHLVVGTRKGVWRAAPRPLTRLTATGQTSDLLSTEAGLLVASGEGVALVRGGTTRVLTETLAYALHRSSRNPETVYVSRYQEGLLPLLQRAHRAVLALDQVGLLPVLPVSGWAVAAGTAAPTKKSARRVDSTT